MKNKNLNSLIKIIILVIIPFGIYHFYGIYFLENTIKIANWNLQIFGQTKASDSKLIELYSSIIKDYDIIFIQEIKDKTGTAFSKLCSELNNYTCIISSRAGHTKNKEQYGVIYKNNIELINFYDYNLYQKDNWERPPIRADFDFKGYRFIIYNIHTKPDNVKEELKHLEKIASKTGNVIIIGDLNADCNYYDSSKEHEFDNWFWVISNNQDTTSRKTNCAYDRILLNSDAYSEYEKSGIYKKDITPEISDHYLIWVELNVD